jgi:hypothetical protein
MRFSERQEDKIVTLALLFKNKSDMRRSFIYSEVGSYLSLSCVCYLISTQYHY